MYLHLRGSKAVNVSKRHRKEIESMMSHAGPSFEQGISKELVDLGVVICTDDREKRS